MPHEATCDDWLSPGNNNPRIAIDGVGIWEWTGSSYQNLTKGINSTFYSTLVAWKQNLHTYSTTYGMPSPIYSLAHYGIYNCRHISGTTTPSYHSYSRAFDLTQVRWGTGTGPTSVMGYPPGVLPGALVTGDHASSSQTLRRRYLAVNAICLKYFKNTLNGWTPDHHNHIHVDNSLTVGVLDTSHAATVRFVQAVCNNMNGASLVIDGNWGSQTQGAFNAANVAMCFNANVFTSSARWKDWCSMIAKHGFNNKALGYYQYATTNCPV